MISCYGGASEGVSARIGSVWKKFMELSGVLFRKQGFSLKIYPCSVRPVLLYCSKMCGLTVADEERLRVMECHMIRIMCGERLVDRVSTDVLWYRVGGIVKI